MRIAFVSIPRYPCAVEVLHKPALLNQPLIVGDAEQPKRVLDLSREAADCGVTYQMTIRKAVGLCPEAIVIPPDPVHYRTLWETILGAFTQITPQVEDEEMGRAYLNISGLQSLYRDETELARQIIDAVYACSGLQASVGIATGKLPAFAAATTAGLGQVSIVQPHAASSFMAPVPIELLPMDEEVLFRLKLLGLSKIGDLASFSVPELQSQFGFQGERLWQLANGIDETILKPRPIEELMEDGVSFEAPVAGIEVLVTVCKQLLSRLLPRLKGRAAREMVLQGELASGRGWEHRLILKEAVAESDRLSFVLRSALNNFPPPNAVRNLSLRLGGLTGETGRQLFLGQKRSLQLQLEQALSQLKARYGHSPIYRCVEVEPWSVIPEQRWILVESDA